MVVSRGTKMNPISMGLLLEDTHITANLGPQGSREAKEISSTPFPNPKKHYHQKPQTSVGWFVG